MTCSQYSQIKTSFSLVVMFLFWPFFLVSYSSSDFLILVSPFILSIGTGSCRAAFLLPLFALRDLQLLFSSLLPLSSLPPQIVGGPVETPGKIVQIEILVGIVAGTLIKVGEGLERTMKGSIYIVFGDESKLDMGMEVLGV